MIVIKMQGRLGNQLFILAFGHALESLLGQPVWYDGLSLGEGLCSLRDRSYYWAQSLLLRRSLWADLARLKLDVRRMSLFGQSVRRLQVVGEPSVPDLGAAVALARASAGDLYFDGYWQSEEYFKPVESLVRQVFAFRRPLPEPAGELKALVCKANSVAVHVRRGDYVMNPRTAAAHNVCGLSYYVRAVETLRDRLKGAHFFVFSDDLDWCRLNMQLHGVPVTFVDTRALAVPHLDLELMASCRHFVISNSSYSWWAAYLGTAPDKVVVAPSLWNRLRTDSHPQCKSWDLLPV